MGKIFYVMGKSASGKDTIYKKLLERFPGLKTVVTYTTRPIRDGETEGVEYHFTSVPQLEQMKTEGRVIESRTYETVFGPWCYCTVNDGQIDLDRHDYLMIDQIPHAQQARLFYIQNYHRHRRLQRSFCRSPLKFLPEYLFPLYLSSYISPS